MKNLIFGGLCALSAVVALPRSAHAQSILGTNLIVNGNAEAGSAATDQTDIVAIPGWTRTGNATVLPYGLTGFLLTNDPAPPDHSFQYFIGSANAQVSTLKQNIDVSSGASTIAAGNVEYSITAYLGAYRTGDNVPVTLTVDFKNATGGIFSTATIGPNAGFPGGGLAMQQRIGYVPAGTVTMTVTLTLDNQFSAADSLSIVLNTAPTTPVLGANLLVNGNAEAGPSAAPYQAGALYIPGWSTTGSSVCPYGGTNWFQTTDPGPTDRGTNLFCGYFSSSNSYQYVDVSAAASLIDGGQVKYQIGAWLGGIAGTTSPTVTYYFYDATGANQLGPTATLGPVGHGGATALVNVSHSDVLPAKTRFVLIVLTFPDWEYLADDVSFSIGSLGAPVITPGGIVPVYSAASAIQPGSWVSIFGTGLASATTTWNGDFPTMLGNTTVSINSKPAYLWFVSPTQINLQAPDDTATGGVNVVVTTPAGSTTSTVTLSQYAPSLSLFNGKYAAAVVVTPGQPGNSGNGYDYIGPGGGALPFTSRPVKAGETVLLYGVGFGPTNPQVAAGAPYSGAASVPVLPMVTVGGVPAKVSFTGIVEAGLFQLNVVVPSAGSGDKPLLATIGGVTTPANVFLTLQ